ncbi:hypothetical protein DL546_005567 [Coniochaeta pulveracea]|uniref:Peptidase S8/S53 domain-containing protein n=1 Tax=Coniochaeta pulveracea TaxID=177199 RepID=A0A420Y1V1_9PEZI|nr:hypothetical protein DL546_005567 [Coniochaeta pulveracea]
MGQRFGVAKQATLIPVVVPEPHTAYDLADAFEAIVQDITASPQKQKHTVIFTTLSVGPDREISDLERLHNAIQQLMDMDVVIVISGGNLNGAAVEEYPQAWASDDFPLIVVGSVDATGAKVPNVPDVVRISTHAVSRNIVCVAGVSEAPILASYFAFGAPQVAGQVAIWLSYDSPPIDRTNGRVARNMRDYVETHPDAGWVRSGGQRVVYNGVTEAINPSFKTCAGLASNKYVERETVRKAVQQDFCVQVPPQSFSKRYNGGSMEDMVLSIQYDGRTPLDHTINSAGCVQFLLGELADGCDAANNPNNWKGGGVADLTGVKYTVTPMAERQPANVARLGICRRGVNGLRDHEYLVIGRGWLSSDAGQEFYQFLFDHCGLRLDSWGFNYYLDEDGREWSVRFATDENIPPSWITEAALRFGAPDDFDCDDCWGSDCS